MNTEVADLVTRGMIYFWIRTMGHHWRYRSGAWRGLFWRPTARVVALARSDLN